MAEHTEGRLKVDDRVYSIPVDRGTIIHIAPDQEAVAITWKPENARRLAACWNALQGFTTAQIEAIAAEQERSITPEFVELHSRIPRT